MEEATASCRLSKSVHLMRKQNGGNERTSYVRRSDDPKNVDRSQLFWSGVNAVRNVQKSSQCDSYHFIASSESRRRHRDVTDGKVRENLVVIKIVEADNHPIMQLLVGPSCAHYCRFFCRIRLQSNG